LLPYGYSYPVPDRIKPSFVILTECPDVKNYKWRLNPVWHRILYSWTHMATGGVKGLTRADRRPAYWGTSWQWLPKTDLTALVDMWSFYDIWWSCQNCNELFKSHTRRVCEWRLDTEVGGAYRQAVLIQSEINIYFWNPVCLSAIGMHSVWFSATDLTRWLVSQGRIWEMARDSQQQISSDLSFLLW